MGSAAHELLVIGMFCAVGILLRVRACRMLRAPHRSGASVNNLVNALPRVKIFTTSRVDIKIIIFLLFSERHSTSCNLYRGWQIVLAGCCFRVHTEWVAYSTNAWSKYSMQELSDRSDDDSPKSYVSGRALHHCTSFWKF